jgi:hypothetical protein
MNSRIELISRPKEGDGLRSTFCIVGESLSAQSSTLYVVRIDDDAIPPDTEITRQGGELHFVFPSRVTFDLTDWDKAVGSELIISSGARVFEDISKRFISGHNLEGGTFRIRTNSRRHLGRLGSSHDQNFLSLEAILSRLRLRNTRPTPTCDNYSHRKQTLYSQAQDHVGRIVALAPPMQARATRCACTFPGLGGRTNWK